ncbi:MAG: hypothetical protein PHR92_16260 [Lachnospiraceae bacterium]|nr:hypothetical protein [Lachnospiraceae bacterium]
MRIYIKHILSGLLFAAGLLLLLSAASYAMIPKDNKEEAGMEDESANGILAEGKNTIDVLVVGDSLAFCTIDPLLIWEQYGFTSYLCSTPSQKLFYTEEFVEKAFRNQSPKMVFLETDALFREYTNGAAVQNRAERVLPVLRYHDRWKKMKPDELFRQPEYTYRSSSKGFAYKPDVDGIKTKKKEVKPAGPDDAVPGRNRKELKKIARVCKENGAELILLSVPSRKDWNMDRHNIIDSLARELGVVYFDMNMKEEEVGIDWKTETKDQGEHLNYDGARKATAYFGKYLAEKNILTDHRGDEAYKTWDKDKKRFEKEIEKEKKKLEKEKKKLEKEKKKQTTKD